MSTLSTSLVNQLNGTTNSSSSSTIGSSSAQDIQNQFLTMLTTQLKNQDPTNPMDSSQMTSQLAQISTVSGISQLNQSIQQLIQSQTASQSMTAANLIGHQALITGNKLTLQGGVANGAIQLDSPADTATINVLNSSGTLVDSFTLNNPSSGITNFSWDGKDLAGNQLSDGQYSLQVQATKSGSAVNANLMTFQTVAGITLNQGASQVVLSNGNKVDLSSVQQVI